MRGTRCQRVCACLWIPSMPVQRGEERTVETLSSESRTAGDGEKSTRACGPLLWCCHCLLKPRKKAKAGNYDTPCSCLRECFNEFGIQCIGMENQPGITTYHLHWVWTKSGPLFACISPLLFFPSAYWYFLCVSWLHVFPFSHYLFRLLVFLYFVCFLFLPTIFLFSTALSRQLRAHLSER